MKENLKITKRSLLKLKEELKWSGEGTSLNPLIINSLGNYPPSIILRKTNCFIHIKNLHRIYLQLICCKNCVIEQNTIHHLALHNCQKIVVNHNTILEVETYYGGANFIGNNRIPLEAYTKLVNKFYQKSEMKFFKQALMIMSFVLFILICLSFFFSNYFSSLYYFIFIFAYLNVALVIFVNYIELKVKEKKSKKLPKNIINDNELFDSKQLNNEFS